MRKGYDRLNGVELVVDRGRRAGKVVDLIHLQEKRLHHIVADELEIGVPEVMHQVLLPPREEIVHHDDAVPPLDQAVHQVATHEPRTASDHDAEPLPLQTQRHLCPDEPPLQRRPVPAVHRRHRELPGAVNHEAGVVAGRRGGGGREGEEDGDQSHPDEHEKEALLA